MKSKVPLIAIMGALGSFFSESVVQGVNEGRSTENQGVQNLQVDIDTFNRALYSSLKNSDPNRSFSDFFMPGDIERLDRHFCDAQTFGPNNSYFLELKNSLKNLDPMGFFGTLFNLNQVNQNAFRYALKILDQINPSALNEAFSCLSKRIIRKKDKFSLDIDLNEGINRVFIEDRSFKFPDGFFDEKNRQDLDIVLLGKALTVLNCAYKCSNKINKGLICENFRNLNEHAENALGYALSTLLKRDDSRTCSFFIHALAFLERIASFEDSSQESTNWLDPRIVSYALLTSLGNRSLSFYIELKNHSSEDFVWLLNALNRYNFSYFETLLKSLFMKAKHSKYLPVYVRVLNLALEYTQKGVLMPNIFSCILNHAIINNYNTVLFKFFEDLNNDTNPSSLYYAFNVLFRKVGDSSKVLLLLLNHNDERLFDCALNVFTSNSLRMMWEIIGISESKFFDSFTPVIDAKPEILTYTLVTLEKMLDLNGVFFPGFFSSFFRLVEKNSLDVLAKALAVLEEKRAPNIFNLALTVLSNEAPRDLVRLLRTLSISNSERLSEVFNKIFTDSLNDKEMSREKHKTLQDALLGQLEDVTFFENQSKMNFYFDFFEDDVYQIKISLECADTLLKSIMGIIHEFSQERKEAFFRKIISKNSDFRLLERYLTLTGTSIESFSSAFQRKIKSNLFEIFKNKDFFSFLKFKDLIDQERSENRLTNYSDEYEIFCEYIKFFADLKKDKYSKDKEVALDFFDKKFKGNHNIEYLVFLFKFFYPEDYFQHLEDLETFKLKNLQKVIDRSSEKRLHRLKNSEKELNDFFKNQEGCSSELNYSDEIKKMIDEDLIVEAKEVAKRFIRRDTTLAQKIKDLSFFNEFYRKIEEFCFVYKNFISSASRKEAISGFFDESKEIFKFIAKTSESFDETDDKFLEYLSSRYGSIPEDVKKGKDFVCRASDKIQEILNRRYLMERKNLFALGNANTSSEDSESPLIIEESQEEESSLGVQDSPGPETPLIVDVSQSLSGQVASDVQRSVSRIVISDLQSSESFLDMESPLIVNVVQSSEIFFDMEESRLITNAAQSSEILLDMDNLQGEEHQPAVAHLQNSENPPAIENSMIEESLLTSEDSAIEGNQLGGNQLGIEGSQSPAEMLEVEDPEVIENLLIPQNLMDLKDIADLRNLNVYKILLRKFNYAARTKKVEKILIQRKKEEFIVNDITSFLTHYIYMKDATLSKNSNFFKEIKELKYFGEVPFSFLEGSMSGFISRYHKNSMEIRQQLLEGFTNFCLRALNNQNLPCTGYFETARGYNTFLKNLRKSSEEYIKNYEEGEEYKNDLLVHHPYSVLERFFQESVTQGGLPGKERCYVGLLTGSVFSSLEISGQALHYNLEVLDLGTCKIAEEL
ncbi:hypothetical protein [Holospora undulata]|uniref:Uncharacterized protein n=1 Tax=Holospora undulata HU1 TaxID=1321371 RepID=A0A061JGU7_9PROT|nr:hypothetical protein [Holospora undulata]ETZ05371.1 hypothetical protein K737_300201 [Holospora undulata HU1]